MINPMDRPCCANCNRVIIRNEADESFNRHLTFRVDADCPHANDYPFKTEAYNYRMEINNTQITDVGNLFCYVCKKWKCYGEPESLD